jgi:hypothetical protein
MNGWMTLTSTNFVKILVNLITLMDKEISLDQNQITSVCVCVTTWFLNYYL